MSVDSETPEGSFTKRGGEVPGPGGLERGTNLVKKGFASMQKGGVIMDVTSVEEAGVAEDVGAVAVMALERVPADIRAVGGVARMADPSLVEEIIDAVTIPVMAKCRIGHLAEAQVLQETGADMIDESEVLTPADPFLHIDKGLFDTPFVCGATYLGEAVRRIWEGAAMIRTKGEAGTGDVVEAVRHRRIVRDGVLRVAGAGDDELREIADDFVQEYGRIHREVRGDGEVGGVTPVFGGHTLNEAREGLLGVLRDVKGMERLPVVDFAAGGIATPADASLMMQLGSDGVFVGSGVFKSGNPSETGRAIVEAVANYDDPERLKEISRGLGLPMKGMDADTVPDEERLQGRGW